MKSKALMRLLKDFFELVSDIPTQKVVLKLKHGVKVDFSHPKSFNDLLGFEPREYSIPFNQAEKIANIDLGRSIVNIKSDLISGGYITTENGLQAKNILFSKGELYDFKGDKIIIKLHVKQV